MNQDIIPVEYQVFYVVIPTISIVGNALIIYVTIRSKMVVCVITAPMTGTVYDVFMDSVIVFNIMTITCYILFVFFLKKLRMSSTNAKQIYRSLIVISLTTVFGWLSTMLIISIADILHIEIERIYVNLLAGLFVNFSCAATFFVYYVMSTDGDFVKSEDLDATRASTANPGHGLLAADPLKCEADIRAD
ncbi:unnamed protein product [Angiostrongylus costaricensis]|uniref:G_PROTEIN_RECEP_F1_2 domain-containing protein n=1 Tax=Angiostrongylus costaricensis TaxID=334426 RepID=A0A0R3Q237_ANGCS|nr:unnamed protein product [Angiostrongylus costaricensis]